MLRQADYMRRIVDDHRAAMDEFDPERKIGLIVDEWGCWHPDGSGPSKGYNLFEQQSTLRDAMVAAMTLNLFNNRCDVVAMANVAQLVNNIHSLFLTAGDKMCKTPTYHVFEMYMPHKGARQIKVVNGAGFRERQGFMPMPQVHVSASEKDGQATITLVNTDMKQDRQVKLGAIGAKLGKATVKILSSADPHDHNDFDNPDKVCIRPGSLTEEGVLVIPAAGIAAVTFEKE
jgi:alpha-N-arabinofuranosidase